MIEVNINYQTFGFTEEQLNDLNTILAKTKVRSRENGFEPHTKTILAVTTTRWSDD